MKYQCQLVDTQNHDYLGLFLPITTGMAAEKKYNHMKLLPYFYLFTILYFGLGNSASAQQGKENKISGHFSNVSFEEFAISVSDYTNFRFFFDPETVKNIQVNFNANNHDLKEILETIFHDSDLKFEIDHRLRVFISKDKKLKIVFNRDFFDPKLYPIDSFQKNTDEDRIFSKNKLWEIGHPNVSQNDSHAMLKGTISALESGKPLPGILIFDKRNIAQTITDQNGNYSIVLPKGRHTIYFQNLGGLQEQRLINISGDGTFDIVLEESIISLKEVIVSSGQHLNISRPEMGVQSMDIQSMKKLPAVFGEVGVIQSILTLPGVSTVGEASAGFNVRGGAADQNLILYQNATVFNPSHLFGFFSAFNPDMVEGVELYKAGIPLEYGGRLSSILDVKTNFGNSEKFSGSGGIGLLTGRLSLQGPVNENTTFMLGFRSTYSDWLFNLLEENTDFNGSRASFYDFNFNLKHKINNNNTVYLTSYLSHDDFSFDRDTLFSYSNKNINIGWTHYFNDKLEGDLIVGTDRYDFVINGRQNILNSFRFGFDIKQWFLKSNFNYEYNDRHTFSFGVHAIRFNLRPGYLEPKNESLILPEKVEQEQALETSLYFGDDYELNNRITVNYGMRYVIYNFLGPNKINKYSEGMLPSESTYTGLVEFGKGSIINTYHGPEFRISGRFSLNQFSSLKAGYNTMRQQIHLLSNTSAITPTDTWKLSDPHVRPQLGDQISIGYYKNFKIDKYEASLEVYHRNMRNLIDYRSGASIILNNDIEQDVILTEGKAYGAEIMLKKNGGKLNGWVSYTLSRSLLRTVDKEIREKVNNGEYYPSNFDQPHNLFLVANYEFSKRINTSLNANYSTGRPVTLPVGKFQYAGSERIFFSDRNQYRIPDYFRIDISANFEGNHKVKKLAHASWSVGVYNLLGRSNPYSVYFTPINGIMKSFQLSIFARPIPFITYNFRF